MYTGGAKVEYHGPGGGEMDTEIELNLDPPPRQPFWSSHTKQGHRQSVCGEGSGEVGHSS